MGYEINSVWTKLKEKDIRKLNEIIDDKYCKEHEIAIKLYIMNKFNDALNDEILVVNWDNVLRFMRENNWTWYLDDDYKIPTKEEIIERIRTDYFNPGLYQILEKGENRYSVFSGGIVFEMGYSGHYGDNYWVSIYFDIAHYRKGTIFDYDEEQDDDENKDSLFPDWNPEE